MQATEDGLDGMPTYVSLLFVHNVQEILIDISRTESRHDQRCLLECWIAIPSHGYFNQRCRLERLVRESRRIPRRF
jgi:hypothetical protein